MRRAAWAAALLVACAQGASAWRSGGTGVRTWVESHTDAGGVLVVQVEAGADAEIEVPEPQVTGLTFQPQGEARVERIGDHTVMTQRWSFAGKKGMYEVPELVAHSTSPKGEATLRSEPLWIDLAVTPPREGTLTDISEPRRVIQPPGWLEVAVAGTVGVAIAGGVALVRASRRPAVAPPPREAPHLRALKAWEAVRHDPAIADHDKTVALSRIFREYMEEVLRFPATAWTTTETLAHLQGISFLPEGNVPRAKRLLRATDRVKFADAATRDEMFDEFDSDLRAFLDSTRPRSWQVEQEAS